MISKPTASLKSQKTLLLTKQLSYSKKFSQAVKRAQKADLDARTLGDSSVMSRQDSSETLSVVDKRPEYEQSVTGFSSKKQPKVVILTDKEKKEEAQRIREFYQSKV